MQEAVATMNSAFELISLRAQVTHSQHKVNDLLSSKEAHITNLEDQVQTLQKKLDIFQKQNQKQVADANSQEIKFQEFLDTSYLEYYLKGYYLAKERGSLEVEEKGNSREDND